MVKLIVDIKALTSLDGFIGEHPKVIDNLEGHLITVHQVLKSTFHLLILSWDSFITPLSNSYHQYCSCHRNWNSHQNYFYSPSPLLLYTVVPPFSHTIITVDSLYKKVEQY